MGGGRLKGGLSVYSFGILGVYCFTSEGLRVDLEASEASIAGIVA